MDRVHWRSGVALALVGIAGVAVARRRWKRDAPATETERVRRVYEQSASRYDQFIRVTERLLLGDGRAWAANQARGDVLEIAIGTGRNLPYYPRDLRFTGQDISAAMLEIARQRADKLGRHVDLQQGDAQALPFDDARFDTVVSTLSMCTIPDDRRAVAEATRVLRAGGRLILLEHVRSPRVAVRLVQRLLEPVLCSLAGDHLLREPLDQVEEEGLLVETLRRERWGIIERLVAIKPSARG